jgi:DNA-binding LacI/PurR family transcriptional regulator
MTANRALSTLRDEGWVTRQPRSGTFVAERARKRKGLIMLLLATDHGALELSLMRGIRSAFAHDFHLLFCATGDDPRREAEYLLQRDEAEGVLCLPTCASENLSLYRKIQDEGPPIVFLDRVPQGGEFDAVVTDNYGASRQALEWLVSRGHRRIAHFTVNQPHISSTQERLQAHQEVLAAIGEPAPQSLLRYLPPFPENPSVLTRQIMHDALCALRRQDEPITAAFCLHEYYMAPLLDVCDYLGIRVPEDLEVVSFDDHPPIVPRYLREVHRIVQRCTRIGELAAERLQRRLRGEGASAEIARVPADFIPANPHPTYPWERR